MGIGLAASLVEVLAAMGDCWTGIDGIDEASHLPYRVPWLLTSLQDMGFAERSEDGDLTPLSGSRWRATREGKAFLRTMTSDGATGADSRNGVPAIVMTLPAHLKNTIGTSGRVVETFDALQHMLCQATHSIDILCPYIDGTFAALVQGIRASVRMRIVTTPVSTQQRKDLPNPCLERLSQVHRVSVKYLREVVGGLQLFQMHAKMVVVDGKVAYLGSANLRETSLLHNVELGILTEQACVVSDLCSIFESVFCARAVGKGELQC